MGAGRILKTQNGWQDLYYAPGAPFYCLKSERRRDNSSEGTKIEKRLGLLLCALAFDQDTKCLTLEFKLLGRHQCLGIEQFRLRARVSSIRVK